MHTPKHNYSINANVSTLSVARAALVFAFVFRVFLWLCADCEVDADTLERDAHEVGDARGGAGLPSASAAAVAAAAAAEAFKAEAGEEVDGVGVAARECLWEPMVRQYFHMNIKVRRRLLFGFVSRGGSRCGGRNGKSAEGVSFGESEKARVAKNEKSEE